MALAVNIWWDCSTYSLSSPHSLVKPSFAGRVLHAVSCTPCLARRVLHAVCQWPYHLHSFKHLCRSKNDNDPCSEISNDLYDFPSITVSQWYRVNFLSFPRRRESTFPSREVPVPTKASDGNLVLLPAAIFPLSFPRRRESTSPAHEVPFPAKAWACNHELTSNCLPLLYRFISVSAL